MRVLITRPIDDGEETARQLSLRGHESLIAPLMTVRFHDGPEVMLDNVQAILATSANGVRALARRTQRRDVAVFAVGPQTAAQAQMLGFTEVKSADGDAEALTLAATGWAEPGNGTLFHVVGEGHDGKLAERLSGFRLRQEILYAVRPVEKMPDEAVLALGEGRLDAALFYSPRSAGIFRDCVLREKLPVEGLVAACISAAAAAALPPLVLKDVRIAAKPNQAALLRLLD